jgi:iron complex outermembrane receptor protein
MDISGHSLLVKTNDYGSFTATGTFNVISGLNRMTGDNLYNIMPMNAKLSLVHSWANWTGTIEEELVGNKKNLSQVRNEIRTGGYSLLNLRGGYEWKSLSFDLGLENVLNKFYAPPLGGTYVGQGPTMSGSAIPWGIPVPGMGRSFYARVLLTLSK